MNAPRRFFVTHLDARRLTLTIWADDAVTALKQAQRQCPWLSPRHFRVSSGDCWPLAPPGVRRRERRRSDR